jgi:hypothetical protein
MGHVLVVPEIVLAAAAELDLLADRMTAAAGINAPVTHVAPSGTEEVSVLAASHFNQHAVAQEQAVAQGVLELRHAAMTLRTQVAQYLGQDVANAASVTSIQA